MSQTELAEWAQNSFGLSKPPSRNTIARIIQTAAEIEKKRHSFNPSSAKGRTTRVQSPELEEQLSRYVAECEQQNVWLTRRLLSTEAARIVGGLKNAPPLKLSDGWLSRFMRRHALQFRENRGYTASANAKANQQHGSKKRKRAEA